MKSFLQIYIVSILDNWKNVNACIISLSLTVLLLNQSPMKNLTILIFLVSIVPCLVYAQTIHVPANYSTIQEGIDAAIHGDTVLVDTGTYIERINFTGKNITVASKYLVTEDTSYISKTIIDGDSLGSVVTITSGEDSTTMLYGFTVQNGADSVGGGIRVIGSNPEIVHNVVKNNTVTHAGGGIYLLNADVKILYTKVSDNNIYPGENTGKGGGIHISGSNPIIHNSIITSNIIHKNNNIWNHLYGGGLFIDLSGGEVRNSVISNNSVLYQYGSGAAWGGGLYINRSNTLISDLIISGNLSRLHGGGISVHTNNVKLINLQIEDNTATFGAGVLDKGGVHIYNSIITQNNGTGIATYNTTRLINCTVIGNLGGGFYMLTYDKMVTTTLYNSILRDNGNYDICGGGDENGRDHIRLSFCNVDEDRICTKYIDVTWLSGNINMDPLFESQFGFPYYLSNESSSINAGRPDTSGFHLPETDIAGNPRLYGTSIDIGAIENQEVRGIIHVPQDYFTIQAAIDAAYDGEMVLVDTGTYVERINFIGKNITVASKYITTQDTNYISQTIIDGDSLGAVVTIGNVEDTTTLLQGFTIQNGTGEKGGGLFIDGADPRIEYCVIKNNTVLEFIW